MACTHSHNGILLAIKKKNLAICDIMGNLRGYFAKWNNIKSEKEEFHTYVELKQTKQNQT